VKRYPSVFYTLKSFESIIAGKQKVERKVDLTTVNCGKQLRLLLTWKQKKSNVQLAIKFTDSANFSYDQRHLHTLRHFKPRTYFSVQLKLHLMERRNAYRILVGKPEGKRLLGSPRRSWVDNIKMDLREVDWNGSD
jgi:hypothetical protein